MRRLTFVPLVAVGLWLIATTSVGGSDLPSDAKKLVEEFKREAAAIQKKADDEIKGRSAKVVERLLALQDAYTKAGKLDEAVAVRNMIQQLKDNPLSVQRAEVQWGNRWWPAEVLQVKDGKYFIRYTGWGEQSNEWVTKDRIRFLLENRPPAPKK